MSELTLHTGLQGEETVINLAWFDENGCPQKTTLEIHVLEQDKPRTLRMLLNGVVVAYVPSTV
jgi:hypothetical protein